MTTADAAVRASGVTWRGMLAGIIGVPVTCFIVSWAEMVLMTLQIGYLQMPPAVIGLLLALLMLNALLCRLSRRFALSPQDLLIAYSMMTLASMISSRGMMQKLIPLLVTANYLGSDANDWRNLYYPHIKQWLVPFDVKGADKQEISLRFFEALRAGETIPWNRWVGPVAIWCILVLLVFGGFLCMAAILRRQWVDNEKLSFPLVQLPLEMVDYGDAREGHLFHNRLTWLGFAIPMIVFLFKGLHAWYPSIPGIPLSC